MLVLVSVSFTRVDIEYFFFSFYTWKIWHFSKCSSIQSATFMNQVYHKKVIAKKDRKTIWVEDISPLKRWN